MLKIGTEIAKRYIIEDTIGSGGMADVYRALDNKLNRAVAIKVLKPEFREDSNFIKKFRSEAQAAAGLTHPNIVSVFDVGEENNIYYIVMELIEGITLKEYINKKGKLSVKEATSIAIQVSMGLEAAHNHGIVHRDVKPYNIIISTDGKVKVTDFGIARVASSNTISSNVMGSVHYSSPEQVRGGYSDEKSDIYSLGITIYEMVTGRVPFDGDTTVAIAIKHLQDEMTPPSHYTPDLPYSLEQIINKCTQKSVDRRYAKMEDVIADLKHSLIEPQGDFVKLEEEEVKSRTRVLTEEDLNEIRDSKTSSEKKNSAEKKDPPEKQKKNRKTDSDQGSDGGGRSSGKDSKKKKKKRRGTSRIFSILGLILGAAAVIALIIFIARAAGLIHFGDDDPRTDRTSVQTPAIDESLVTVPDLIGKTEEEATQIAKDLHLGIQMMGEEASTQAQGLISRQTPLYGNSVPEYSTIQYYVSKGTDEVTIPYLDGKTGIEAREMLENLGLRVSVSKIYSEYDDYGNAEVQPGYAYYTEPEEGGTARSGDAVTLYVSRGLDFGDSAEVPNVLGMYKNEALTVLGKWTDIQINEVQSDTVAAGEVMEQSLEGGTYADPDLPITLTISLGNQPAAASGEVWKCTQRLNIPDGYQGGQVKLELVQEVNGSFVASTILEGAVIEFPYRLDLTGAPGISSGTLYLSEMVNGAWEELGHYPLTFEKTE